MESTTNFLRGIIQKYPEVNYLAGQAEASPEGNPTLSANALAPLLFEKYDPTAIEADRTFMGLILFNAVLNNDHSKYPHLNPEQFHALRDWTLLVLENNQDYIELTYYSLACNDLGKTQFIVDANIASNGRKAPDHDQVLAEVVKSRPDLFPGLKTLKEAQQQQYIEGLAFNLNLGQMVQGENLPFNLSEVPNIPYKSKELRLLAEFYDFAGATGHINNKICILLTPLNYELYRRAIDLLLANSDAARSYSDFIKYRAAKVGLDAHPDWFIVGRLAALSRAADVKAGEAIFKVWNNFVTPSTRELLRREMNITGLEGIHAILIYYFPAVIANSIKLKKNDLVEGLTYALEAVAPIYEKSRAELVAAGLSDTNGVYTVNVNDLAKSINAASTAQPPGEKK